ncbi:hypothetical protein FRC02_004229 [Tulasnella sp. 418]|nr:hypothetical protein FRC02_004229 [Tulasnella sp. 418]
MVNPQATGMPMFGGVTGLVASPFGIASTGDPFGQQMERTPGVSASAHQSCTTNATYPFGSMPQQAGPTNASSPPFANLQGHESSSRFNHVVLGDHATVHSNPTSVHGVLRYHC